ncbi:C3 and PZP-like alpha-2-macroglobulin domain-containing protein 8 [Amyelois transitella]|uniref:C3 and PZP-like alpha-2-macroglobulin domain-containing protein 8 n=1 Tax=Amyelois transitella TaxID=680683 RepID=UPI00299021F0|nr:C3 and PZP-like alpha-2-macroglobulin domain-containing protein 8 [Amyelois transitella]
MMTHSSKLYCLIVVLIAPTIQCISVVGPRVLRPFSTYTVAVAGGSRAYTLYVAVEGRSDNGQQFTQGQEVQVPPATSRHIQFDISDPGPGQYSLVARSTSGPQFSSSAPISYQPRSFCVFMQTDKRVYKPGDIVNLRVIALNKYLLPLTGTVDVSILDTGGSPVQEWAAMDLDRGIFTNQVKLSDEPALGEWTIQVEVRGQTYSRRILVADYVTPKFHMDMQMPKELLFSEGRFLINVTAKHFNGLPVRGELTISAYAVFFSGLLQPVFSSPARKVVEFNGNSEVVYDLKTDLDLAEDAARPLVIEAVLEEKDTLVRQNVSSRVLLLRAPYRLKVSAPEYFKPNLPYNVQIEVADSLGQVMKENGEVTVERLWDDGAPPNTTSVPLREGLATYTLIPDELHANSTLNLLIKYKEVTERVIQITSSKASGGRHLNVEVLTRDTAVGDELRARITSTEPMDLVHYVIIGRGDILVAKTLELSPARVSVDIAAAVSRDMSPGCVLLAWRPRLDNTLLAAAVLAPQHKLLQHKVSVLPPTATSYRPKSLVSLSVQGSSGANVGVLAADNTAIAAGVANKDGLGSGIDMHTIEREVESFSGLKHALFKNEDHLPGVGADLGGYTSGDVFTNAGVVILTDGLIIQNDKIGALEPEPETATRPPLAGPYAFSRLPPPPAPRYYLPVVSPLPTWAFSNLTLGFDGAGSIERRAPPSSVDLTVGAIAVDPNLGLGLASPQNFQVQVPLSISAELPESMQRGETLAAVVVLKSTLTVDTSVEVTFYNSDQYFEFEPLDNDIDSAKKIELFRRLRVMVPARGSASTAFLVTVVRTGQASVLIEASGNGVSDSLSRIIDVKDGYEETVWSWELLDARRGIARANATLQPKAGTKLGPALLQAGGDIVAAVLNDPNERELGFDPMPAASPPHALRPLAKACILLDYLQATERDDLPIVNDARAQVQTGFQRLMAYRQKDGSFATFSDSEDGGDVYMTSISCRWLSRCARHVSVSPRAGAAAARWLAARQLPRGGWSPTPASLRTDPRAQAEIPNTAHALLALQQARGGDILYKSNIDNAADFLSQGLSPSLDAYTLAVTAHALAVAQHPQAKLALQMMDQYVNSSGSTLFWSRKLSGSEWRNPWLRDNTLEANTAAHGLQALMLARLEDQATSVARALLQAARPADPDPDVIDALAKYAEMTRTSTKLRISVNVTGTEETRQFQIMDSNAFIIQNQQIRTGRSASGVTEGRGAGVLGLWARGDTNVTAAWPRFTLDPRVDQVSTTYRLQLSICIGFVPQGNETESGLALLTVQLPTGYLADINTLTELTAARHVSTARLSRGGARVSAWLRAARGERCATLAAPRVVPAARQRPGWATLEDLYDSSHRARVFYQPLASSACDVCREWASCARACGAAASQRAAAPGRARAAPDAATQVEYQPILLVLTIGLTLLTMR